MKKLFFLVLILVSLKTYAQENITVYLEVRGSLDFAGNIYLDPIMKPKKMTRTDSLIDYSSFKPLAKNAEPIQVINMLAELGWELASVTHVPPAESRGPNFPFILYYFKKELVL